MIRVRVKFVTVESFIVHKVLVQIMHLIWLLYCCVC